MNTALPFTRNHNIPDEFERIAEDLQGFRLASDIHEIMCRLAQKRNIEISWTERDIRTRYPANHGTVAWRAEAFLQRLLQDGRSHTHTVCEDGVIDTVVWLMDDGDTGLFYDAANVSIFDNTFNTNSLGLKLGVLSTIDRFGCTRLVGASLMRSETRAAFVTVLRAFQTLAGIDFAVLLTDGDLWLADGIREACPSCTHLLCTWHLSKNLLRNVKAAFGNKTEDWHAFLHAWWKLCMKSDSSTIDQFDEEWSELRSFLTEHVTDPDGYACHKALRYLGGPEEEEREQFVPDEEDGNTALTISHAL